MLLEMLNQIVSKKSLTSILQCAVVEKSRAAFNLNTCTLVIGKEIICSPGVVTLEVPSKPTLYIDIKFHANTPVFEPRTRTRGPRSISQGLHQMTMVRKVITSPFFPIV